MQEYSHAYNWNLHQKPIDNIIFVIENAAFSQCNFGINQCVGGCHLLDVSM